MSSYLLSTLARLQGCARKQGVRVGMCARTRQHAHVHVSVGMLAVFNVGTGARWSKVKEQPYRKSKASESEKEGRKQVVNPRNTQARKPSIANRLSTSNKTLAKQATRKNKAP